MNFLENKAGRAFIAFAFYFAEGAPIGFIWWAMPTLLRQHGVGVDVIGVFTATLTLPWVFKFLWAPLIDVFRSSRFGFTKWIALSQILMCITLIPLIFIPLSGNVMWWCVLLFLHSLCAATQDVSVDAMIINLVAINERGMLNGYMQAGMLLGRSLFGGAVLVILPKFGLPTIIAMMVLTILCILVLLIFIKEPSLIYTKKNKLYNFKKNIRDIFFTKRTWYTIAFALTAAAAFEASGAMLGPFLIDKNIDLKFIGFLFGFPVVVSMLLGGLLGGYLSDKVNRKKSVMLFLCATVLTVAVISIIGFSDLLVPKTIWTILFSIMFFFTGMFTTSSYALFMDATHPKLGASQFSTFMAATNGCEAWVVGTTGFIAACYSYSSAFLIMCLVSLFSLFFLMRITKV